MKRNFKSTSAKVLAVALAVGMVATSLPATVADAKKAVKKPTLGKTKVSINVGKTKKITVKKNKGPKVKKVTIKLSKKQKKIVKITKKTKTYIKVKGLKAGKTTLKVKIKAGKKTYTQKLKVTVVKGKTPVTNTPAPTTATSNKPADSTPAASAGTGTTPAPSGATESQAPTTTPPAGPVEKTDITLKYDYDFPAARQVLFEDAVEGYPSYGIDVRDYAKVIVKIAATKEIVKVGDWAGKVTLSSTAEDAGMTAYTDGFYTKYFNDVAAKGGFADGVYTFTFDIGSEGLVAGWEVNDLDILDCISLQLNTEDDVNSYESLTLKEISFILPEGGPVTPTGPAASVEPTTPKPTIDTSKETDTTKVGDLTLSADSDVKTLKATTDADGNAAVRVPFTKNNEYLFFDVSDIDFTKIASVKVTADVPAQMAFRLFADGVINVEDSWYNKALGADYPFWNGSSVNRDPGGAPGDPGKETYTFDMSKLGSNDPADIKVLAINTNAAPGGKDPWPTAVYLLYGIEFVQKEVTVTAAAAKSAIEVGEKTTITAEAKLAGEETESTITYKSSDDTIATVDAKGEITAVKAGNATITVTATVDGITKPATAEVPIEIKEKSTNPSVELGLKTGSPAKIGTGLTTALDVTVRNATNATVTYEFASGDTGTATVTTDEGGITATVKGTKAGTVTVTAKITVDSKDYTSAPVVITVVDPTVEVSAKTISRVTVGNTIELTAKTEYPDDATVSYTSGATDVATVDAKGVVTGVKAGKATITATITVDEENYTDTIEIEVVAAPTADLDIKLTNATGLGNATISDQTDASAKITFTQAYNSSIKVSVTLDDGVALTDYYGISLELADAKAEDGSEISGAYGKNVYVELKGKAGSLTGISYAGSNVAIATPAATSGGKFILNTPIVSAFDLTNIAKAEATTGTFDIAIGVNDLPKGTNFVIKNVKLLKEAPTA